MEDVMRRRRLAINLMGNALRDWLDPHMKL